MKPIDAILIVGTGKLAESLLIALTQPKCTFDIWVAGRNHQKMEFLCKRFKVKPFEATSNFKMPVLLCVSDDAIESSAKSFGSAASCIIHCSGATSIEVLPQVAGGRGVLWPLQSFGTPKTHDEWRQIPLVTEAEGKNVHECINLITSVLGGTVYELNGDARKKLHLSAVFMNNFSNHIARLTHDYCSKNNLPFEALKPLMSETLKNVFSSTPDETQTGPARRGDTKVLSQHEIMLANEPEMLEIYRYISHQIIKHYH
ncbi:MAG: Rossmann-like and DUF2520 domain-containing protein [Bacteroidia bacterium]